MPPDTVATIGRRTRTLVAALALWCINQPVTGAEPAAYLTSFTQTRAIIETSRLQCLSLDIYLADTPEQQRQGLMFIEQMDTFEGMLFRYNDAATITMWMKNTFIPLDMLFIRADGYISGVARETTPQSTARISSPEPVSYVLELNAGLSAKWRIDRGNRLLVIN
jgi:uncharacterized membrane protein (UPF0127 family)